MLGSIMLWGLAGCQSLFYYPSQRRFFTPEMFGDPHENVWITTADGARLHGWMVKAKAPAPRGIVLFFHGNAHNISHYYLAVKGFVEAGYHLLTFDYRGYGLSEGVPSPEGLLLDAQAVWEFLQQRPEFAPGKVVILGQSLGGAVALDWIGRTRPEGIGLVISESAFSSYEAIVEEKLNPLGIVRIFRKPLASGLFDDEHAPIRHVARVSPTPLLIVHGTHDTTVSYAHAQVLFNASSSPKLLWTIEGGGHISMLTRHGSEYWGRLLLLMDQLLLDDTPDPTWTLRPGVRAGGVHLDRLAIRAH